MKSTAIFLALCCLQASAVSSEASSGVGDLGSGTSGREALRQFTQSASTSLRLTAYDLPGSVLYYLPSSTGEKHRQPNSALPQLVSDSCF